MAATRIRTATLETHLDVIKRLQASLLAAMAEHSDPPSQTVLDEMAVYEFILRAEDPNEYASKFRAAQEKLRMERGSYFVPKKDVAVLLRWNIKWNTDTKIS